MSSPLSKALDIQGWMTERELAFLYGIAHSVDDGGTIVEIGSWKGRSTVAICEGVKDKRDVTVYAVDTFAGDEENVLMRERYGSELAEDRVFTEFRANTAGYPFLELLRMTSAEASTEFDSETVDWVFIDAEHTFDRVRDDLGHWFSKVKRGGLISGHDYGHFDVTRAVDTHLRGVDAWESIWYARRTAEELSFRPRPFLEAKLRAALRRLPRVERRARRLQIRGQA